VPSQPWDLTVPGRFYDMVKSDYPNSEQQTRVDFEFRQGDLKEASAGLRTTPITRLLSKDGKALVQIGPDTLSINKLKPYKTWPDYFSSIKKILKIYNSTFHPKGYKRIGLKYVNKIDFDQKMIEPEDYFNIYPVVPKELAEDYFNLRMHAELPYDETDRMILQLILVPPSRPDQISMVLDLDYVLTKQGAVKIGESEEWLKKAHTRIEDAFEKCINEKTRNILDGK